MKRANISLNEPLQKLRDEVKETSPTGGFSRRLGDIVNEFGIIMKLTELPHFSDEELCYIGELILGAEITASKVSGLHLDACDIGQPELAEKLQDLSPAQRIKLIELIYSMEK